MRFISFNCLQLYERDFLLCRRIQWLNRFNARLSQYAALETELKKPEQKLSDADQKVLDALQVEHLKMDEELRKYESAHMSRKAELSEITRQHKRESEVDRQTYETERMDAVRVLSRLVVLVSDNADLLSSFIDP